MKRLPNLTMQSVAVGVFLILFVCITTYFNLKEIV